MNLTQQRLDGLLTQLAMAQVQTPAKRDSDSLIAGSDQGIASEGGEITLKQKLLTALEGATSQTAITTECLSVGHVKSRVRAELLMMYANRQVCTCTIRKPNQSPVDVWWLAGNTVNSKCFERAPRSNKKRVKRVEVDE